MEGSIPGIRESFVNTIGNGADPERSARHTGGRDLR
ncbi:hypothetical protein Rrhod_1551 [Rhodococcus rhodnii LMG 5362]|uniref:Uncharacterized protein n=1 Tax=Rhodococcus rhodnii LMG 5362 TaxID=1273125 RepID=R7WSN3_9NOCA|nr:hypothetical protein Rrhod_1551 [Rhodococcus rhodnii LMG 5362]